MGRKKKPLEEKKVLFFASARDDRIEIEKFDIKKVNSQSRYYSCVSGERTRIVTFWGVGEPNEFRAYGWTPEEAENALRYGLMRRAEKLVKEAEKYRVKAADTKVLRVNF